MPLIGRREAGGVKRRVPATKLTLNQEAPCVTAERSKGSPPPELPNYACDSATESCECKYIFRNQKVIYSNR
jgi:hypothetical protein